MTVGALKRTIPFAMQYQIDRDGNVIDTETRKKLPHATVNSRYGLVYLSCWFEGQHQIIWRLMSSAFYDGRVILPRDGNFLNWKAENTVILETVSSKRITEVLEIHAVWYWYQKCGVPCRNIAEQSGLIRYGEQDFRSLVKDILVAGIR
jgi:hypothetical protein